MPRLGWARNRPIQLRKLDTRRRGIVIESSPTTTIIESEAENGHSIHFSRPVSQAVGHGHRISPQPIPRPKAVLRRGDSRLAKSCPTVIFEGPGQTRSNLTANAQPAPDGGVDCADRGCLSTQSRSRKDASFRSQAIRSASYSALWQIRHVLDFDTARLVAAYAARHAGLRFRR